MNLWPILPATDTAEDLAAAHLMDGFANRLYLDPVLRGSYPVDVVEATRDLTDWGFVQPGDASVISAPIDVLGNQLLRPPSGRGRRPSTADWADFPRNRGIAMLPPQGELTDMGWEISPADLTDLLVRLDSEYGVPLMVTENGAAFPDALQGTGRVQDTRRIAYLEGHVGAVLRRDQRRARTCAPTSRGHCWTTSNGPRATRNDSDWSTSTTTTLARHPKDSALWFAGIARGNRLP